MGPDGTQYPVKKVTRKSRWVSVHDGKPVSLKSGSKQNEIESFCINKIKF